VILDPMLRRRARPSTAAGLILLLSVLACSRSSERAEGPVRLPVDVFADTGRSERLEVRPPPPGDPAPPPAQAEVWLTKVAPTRPDVIEVSLPEAAPETLDFSPPPPRPLVVDEDLKPPILRTAAPLVVPRGASRGTVELDVRVDEDGTVSDALWAGGSSDSILVEAAIGCAQAMRFYPALQSGRPVAVWCRQRFDFAGRVGRP
jgi:TonB family protein